MKASDFIKQLEQNPEYLERKRQDNETLQNKLKEIKSIEAPFIEDLHNNGFAEIEFASDLLNLKKVNPKLVGLILKWLPKIENTYDSQEMLVRGLVMADEPFDDTILLDLFDNKNSSFNLKWVIANTIASTRIQNIEEWLETKLTSKKQPKENEMLIYAANKYFPYAKAIRILRELFINFPLQVADAFTYIGKKDDLKFLIENNKGFEEDVEKNIKSSINKIRKRIKS
jgi:hypothetical protein